MAWSWLLSLHWSEFARPPCVIKIHIVLWIHVWSYTSHWHIVVQETIRSVTDSVYISIWFFLKFYMLPINKYLWFSHFFLFLFIVVNQELFSVFDVLFFHLKLLFILCFWVWFQILFELWCCYCMVCFLARLLDVNVFVEQVFERHEVVFNLWDRRDVLHLLPNHHDVLGESYGDVLFLLLTYLQELPREHLFEVLFAYLRGNPGTEQQVYFSIINGLRRCQLVIQVRVDFLSGWEIGCFSQHCNDYVYDSLLNVVIWWF